MSFLSIIFTFLMIWWTVLFTTLPWGNKQPEVNQIGMAGGAPVNPNIKKKLIATTILSIVLVGIVYACVSYEIIDFREIARDMDQRIYGERTDFIQ